MSLLNVLFFGPIMPLGVIFTLFAQVLEVKSDLLKMLFVRRKISPDHNVAIRQELLAFLIGAIISCSGWHLSLTLITYNDGLYEWAGWRFVVTAGCLLWIFGGLAVSVMCAYRFSTRVDAETQTYLAADVLQESRE